jgi:hypothetical protein
MPRFYGTRELHWGLSFYSPLHHGRCEMSVYHDVQTTWGQEKSLQSEEECTKPRGDLIDTHCWHIKWLKTGLDRKKLRALWLQNGPSGLNSKFHAWFDGTTIANELENGNNQPDSPLFDTNMWLYDLTQTVLLTAKFKAFTCNIILCRSLYKLLSEISYAFLLSFHRVKRPVHRDVLHVTTLTKLDGLKESQRFSLRRLIRQWFSR